MKVNEMIEELKPLCRYDKEKKLHYMGSTILTNSEMKRMCEVVLEESYTKLNNTQREKIRQRIFRELINNGEE